MLADEWPQPSASVTRPVTSPNTPLIFYIDPDRQRLDNLRKMEEKRARKKERKMMRASKRTSDAEDHL